MSTRYDAAVYASAREKLARAPLELQREELEQLALFDRQAEVEAAQRHAREASLGTKASGPILTTALDPMTQLSRTSLEPATKRAAPAGERLTTESLAAVVGTVIRQTIAPIRDRLAVLEAAAAAASPRAARLARVLRQYDAIVREHFCQFGDQAEAMRAAWQARHGATVRAEVLHAANEALDDALTPVPPAEPDPEDRRPTLH